MYMELQLQEKLVFPYISDKMLMEIKIWQLIKE